LSTQTSLELDPEAIRARRASANRTLTVLKAALNFAFQEERLASDVAWRRVKPFREVDVPVMRFLLEHECVRLINSCDGGFRNLVQAALLTGCRYGELARLQVKDFNVIAGTIAVRQSKAGKARHIYLTDVGQSFFGKIVKDRNPTAPILMRDGGELWNASNQQRVLHRASKDAQIEPAVTFHILRHTYASMLAMRSVPLKVIAEMLGHADTRMTEKHYAFLAPTYVAETVRAALPSFGIVSKGPA
jgi:integrase